MELKTGRVRIGVGGWEHDILDSVFYGTPGLGSEAKLARFARHFDCVEVRQTFWDGALTADDAARWIDAVADSSAFRFVVKLHRSFTHEKQAPPDLRVRVRSLVGLLDRSGRLGTLLAQFPFSFTNTGANRKTLSTIAELFRGFPLSVELRHASWHGAAILRLARDLGFALVSPDLPRLPQFFHLHGGTGDGISLLRLHGRNEKGWLLKRTDERYEYLYNVRELLELRRRTEAAGNPGRDVYVVFNNTPGGRALVNALQFTASLGEGRPLSVPPQLLAAFPQLRSITDPSLGEESLFSGEPIRTAS